MKGISKLSKMIKVKSLIWVFILLCLIGLLVILYKYYYKYAGFEGFNTNAPVVKRQLRTTDPIRVGIFYGGRDWFHLNSLLFFDNNGKLIEYGRDYSVYSTDGFGWWGAQDYKILFNTNPNQKDTYYHSSSTNCSFVIHFVRPQYISRIYIRNRLGANNSGGGFRECRSGIHYRIQNYKFMLWSHNGRNWRQAMFEHKLGRDGHLMKGPNYDIILNFIPYRDLAAEAAAAAAAAKIEEDSRKAEKLRKDSINDYLTKASGYEDTARLSNESSNEFLQKLQKYTNDTKFMTEPIRLDMDTSNDIKSDSIIQISNNDMTSNVQTSKIIVNNINMNQKVIEYNLTQSVILLKKIGVAYTNIISTEISLPDIKQQLSALAASSEEMAKFDDTRRNIETYKVNAKNNIITATTSMNTITSTIQNIISSKAAAEINLTIVEKMEKLKRNIKKMNDINEKENEASIELLQEITKSNKSAFGSGLTPGLIV